MLAALALMAATASPAPLQTTIEAAGPAGALQGTLLGSARKGGPVMLIIPGSGPTDRNGDNPMGVKASTYRLLAEGLATRGITTVRIDKRGMFGSKAAISDGNAVTIADYADDVTAWTKVLREKTGARCVWLLGHSEGGLVALAAAQGRPDICGLILVSAPGRPLGIVLREQLKANPANAPLLDRAFAALDELEAGKRVEAAGLPPALMPLFAPQIQGFLISLLSYDPAKLLGSYSGPALILQGERDIQVGRQDANRLKEANAQARLVLLSNANHVLKAVASEDRAANLATYADPALPLAPGVVEAIADFVGAK